MVVLLLTQVSRSSSRYYESTYTTREDKVKDTLRTIGSSVFVGGASTLLGVIPLAWSGSGIIRTVFVMFMGMISLGVAHGLILLPVILSYLGPIAGINTGKERCNTEATESEQGKLSSTSGSATGSTDVTTPMSILTVEFDAPREESDGLLVSPLGLAEEDRQPSYTAPQLSRISSFGTEYSV